MGWLKVDDNIRNNDKFRELGRRRVYKVSEQDLCELVYERILKWCSRNLTDGVISEVAACEEDPTGGTAVAVLHAQGALLTPKELADQVAAGSRSDVDQLSILNQHVDRQGIFIVPNYLRWQRSREQVEHEREQGRLRQQKRRSAGQPQGDPPVSRRDSRRDAPAGNGVTPGVTRDHSRSDVTPLVTRLTDTDTEVPSSSRAGNSRKQGENDQGRPTPNGEVGKWAYDGPPEKFEVNWDNPRCTLHFKIPEGVRGDPCGMCAQLARRARQRAATTGTQQTAAQASRNGDTRRERMFEIAREMFGDEALEVDGPQPPGLRAIKGGRNSG